jgi:hypothetical protein
MLKILFGNRMRRGQKLTVAERRAITDSEEFHVEHGTFKGVQVVGTCTGCGRELNWNWGCDRCRK